jgi:hypothetical protein
VCYDTKWASRPVWVEHNFYHLLLGQVIFWDDFFLVCFPACVWLSMCRFCIECYRIHEDIVVKF